MNYKRGAVLVSVLVLVLSVTVSLAASVHLKGGKNAEPTFTDLGLQLRAEGELSGLGNGDVLITLDAEADVVSTCQNPGNGEHFPPGQNPAPITVSGTQAIPAPEVKNGNTPFDVTTEPLESVIIPGAPDCPNSSWTEEIQDLLFTSATITVEQPEGSVVLIVECTIDPPSSDGTVNKNDVTCTQTQP